MHLNECLCNGQLGVWVNVRQALHDVLSVIHESVQLPQCCRREAGGDDAIELDPMLVEANVELGELLVVVSRHEYFDCGTVHSVRSQGFRG